MQTTISGRRAAKSRMLKKSRSGPRKNNQPFTPKYKNKVLEWLSKNKPEWVVLGNTLHPDLLMALRNAQMSVAIYKRILLNQAIMTLDELYDLAKVLKCSPKDLL